jgi:hypothetical protein
MVLVTGRHYVVGIAGFPFSFSCFGNCVGTDSRPVETSGVVVDTSIDYSCVLQAHHRDFLLRSSFDIAMGWLDGIRWLEQQMWSERSDLACDD